MNRRAQKVGGGGAAALVGIITGFIILYILFLPAEDRAALLGEEYNPDDDGGSGTGGGTGTTAAKLNYTILKESVGTISYLGETEVEHDIPNVYLFETTEAKVLEKINNFYVRNGWFDKVRFNTTFDMPDLDNTDNILLSFVAKKRRGTLTIILNGETIYSYPLTTINVEPIELKKSSLKPEGNVLEFSVDDVGYEFWKTNEYSFESVKIIGDITDISRQESRNIFTVTSTEYDNAEKATLEFLPACSQSTVGILDVLINKRNVFSAVPDCEIKNKVEMPMNDLNAGENNVIFRTNRGSYRIENIMVKTDLKEARSLIYYFELNSSVYRNIENGTQDILLSLTFVNDDESKEAEVNLNGHLSYIDQTTPTYTRNIDYWVKEGNNYVEIKPKTVLHVVELAITTG